MSMASIITIDCASCPQSIVTRDDRWPKGWVEDSFGELTCPECVLAGQQFDRAVEGWNQRRAVVLAAANALIVAFDKENPKPQRRSFRYGLCGNGKPL